MSCFVVFIWLCGSRSWCRQRDLIMSGKVYLFLASFQCVSEDEGPCLAAGGFYCSSGIRMQLRTLHTSFYLDLVPSPFWCSVAGSN